MQRLELDQAQVEESAVDAEDYIECLEGAKFYLCYAEYSGTVVMCIHEDGKWRPTSQAELIGLM